MFLASGRRYNPGLRAPSALRPLMDNLEIPDPVFREAVSAIDAGDVNALEHLLATQPRLVRDRIDCGEGYFRRPYLFWFVAENPIRNGRLPGNIVEVTRAILKAAERQRVDSLGEQVDYALQLVCSGRVARECGVQRELIDVLGDAGADLGAKDRIYQGTPLDWAEHLRRTEIAAYSRGRAGQG